MIAERTKLFNQKRPSSAMAEMSDGYIFYDAPAGQVYFLNLTAAAVFELCDGTTSAAAIAETLKESFDLLEPPVDAVNDCLEGLASAGLVEEVQNYTFSFKRLFSQFFTR
jgi:hypothetical protein